MHCTYPAEIGSGCDTAIDLLWISNYEISAQVWNMNAHDPDGYRAMAAAHLVSSCAKHDLLEITKTSIFKLRSDELDVYVHSLLQEDSGVQGLSALMSALHLTEDLIIGPVSFPEFMQLLNGDCDAAHTPRRTYIVIVRAEPLAPACRLRAQAWEARQGAGHPRLARQRSWLRRLRTPLMRSCARLLRRMASPSRLYRLRSGLSEELACTAASRDYARTRLPGEPNMLAKHGGTLSGPELINHGTRQAGAAMAPCAS